MQEQAEAQPVAGTAVPANLSTHRPHSPAPARTCALPHESPVARGRRGRQARRQQASAQHAVQDMSTQLGIPYRHVAQYQGDAQHNVQAGRGGGAALVVRQQPGAHQGGALAGRLAPHAQLLVAQAVDQAGHNGAAPLRVLGARQLRVRLQQAAHRAQRRPPHALINVCQAGHPGFDHLSQTLRRGLHRLQQGRQVAKHLAPHLRLHRWAATWAAAACGRVACAGRRPHRAAPKHAVLAQPQPQPPASTAASRTSSAGRTSLSQARCSRLDSSGSYSSTSAPPPGCPVSRRATRSTAAARCLVASTSSSSRSSGSSGSRVCGTASCSCADGGCGSPGGGGVAGGSALAQRRAATRA